MVVDDSDYLALAGLQWHVNKDQQVFISASRGYKGHALDNTSNSIFFRAPLVTDSGTPVTPEDATLDPESVMSYELGTKNTLLKNRLTLNATLFYSIVKDFQISAYDGSTNSFRLINAGSVESRGLEFEFQSQPWSGAYSMVQ